MPKNLLSLYIKKDGKTKKLDYSEFNIDNLSDCQHLCFDCVNGRPSKCQKIFDEVKRIIDEYDFIIDGYQFIDIDDIVDKFVVSKCHNYEYEKNDRLSPQLKMQIRQNFVLAYFGANNIVEAMEIEEDLIKKGDLRDFDDLPKIKKKI